MKKYSGKSIFLALPALRYFKEQCFFNLGLNFVLRGVQEQHNLVPSQFVLVLKDTCVMRQCIIEVISKNNQHHF